MLAREAAERLAPALYGADPREREAASAAVASLFTLGGVATAREMLVHTTNPYAIFLAAHALRRAVDDNWNGVAEAEMDELLCFLANVVAHRAPDLETAATNAIVDTLCLVARRSLGAFDGAPNWVRGVTAVLRRSGPQSERGAESDSPVPADASTEVTRNTPPPQLELSVALALISAMNAPAPSGMTFAAQRKAGTAFRDDCLVSLLETTVTAIEFSLTHLEGAGGTTPAVDPGALGAASAVGATRALGTAPARSACAGWQPSPEYVGLALRVFVAASLTDFSGLSRTEELSDDSNLTVNFPSSWKPLLHARGLQRTLWRLYDCCDAAPALRVSVLECLVQLAGCRRSLFNDDERQAWLHALFEGALGPLRSKRGLDNADVLRELCVFCNRLKPNYQLTEFLVCSLYDDFAAALLAFTLDCFSSWNHAHVGDLSLLCTWNRLVSAESYARCDKPTNFCTMVPQVVATFVRSRMAMSESIARRDEAAAALSVDPLSDDFEALQLQLTYFAGLVRYRFAEFAPAILTAWVAPTLERYRLACRESVELARRVSEGGHGDVWALSTRQLQRIGVPMDAFVAVLIAEQQLAWLVLMVSFWMTTPQCARDTDKTGAAVDADSIVAVLSVMNVVDARTAHLGTARPTWWWNERNDCDGASGAGDFPLMALERSLLEFLKRLQARVLCDGSGGTAGATQLLLQMIAKKIRQPNSHTSGNNNSSGDPSGGDAGGVSRGGAGTPRHGLEGDDGDGDALMVSSRGNAPMPLDPGSLSNEIIGMGMRVPALTLSFSRASSLAPSPRPEGSVAMLTNTPLAPRHPLRGRPHRDGTTEGTSPPPEPDIRDVLVELVVDKLLRNLRTWSPSARMVRATTLLLSDMMQPYAASVVLVQLAPIQELLANAHAVEGSFPFQADPAMRRERLLFRQVITRLLLTDRVSQQQFESYMHCFQSVMNELVTMLSARAGDVRGQNELLSSVSVRGTLTGVLYELRGVCHASNTQRSYGYFFEAVFPQIIDTLVGVVDVIALDAMSETTLEVALLRFFAEFGHNRASRIIFDAHSVDGFRVFKSVCAVTQCCARRRFVQLGFSPESAATESSPELVGAMGRIGDRAAHYGFWIKGCYLVFLLMDRALVGGYCNLGVFDMYSDPVLRDSIGIALRLVVALDVGDVSSYPKLSSTLYPFLERVMQLRLESVGALPTHFVRQIFAIIEVALSRDGFHRVAKLSAASAVNRLATSLARETRKQSAVAAAFHEHLVADLGVFARWMELLFTCLIYDDGHGHGVFGEPILPLMVLDTTAYERFSASLLAQYHGERAANLAAALQRLVADFDVTSLEARNRMQFTERLVNFRLAVRGVV